MRFLLWILVTFHMFLVVGNLASAIVAPFLAPWYLACPVVFTVVWVVFAKAQCPLTRLENRLRRRLGMKYIRTFIGHYIMKPVYIFLTFVGLLPPRQTS